MSDTATLPDVETEAGQKLKYQPPYHVVLLNDDDHSYLYVVAMLKELFAHPVETGWKMAETVDKTGRVIVLTTTKEHAELKQEQIHAYGPDPTIERCKGSMSAEIEPAEWPGKGAPMGDATGPPFGSFRDFYPYYLTEHSNRWNRRLHFTGQVLAVSLLVGFAATLNWWLLPAAPLAGYGVSWVGHFLVEGNRPATFRHPLYSLRGDVTMCRDMLTGRVPFGPAAAGQNGTSGTTWPPA